MEKLTSVRPNTIEESELSLSSPLLISEIEDEPITAYLIKSTVNEDGVVRAWEEDILLPTYEIGAEEKILFSLRKESIKEVPVLFILIL